jgi:hypothetical protein
MRILSLVFSSLVALLVTVLALAYLPGYFGRERIYLEDRPEVATLNTVPGPLGLRRSVGLIEHP